MSRVHEWSWGEVGRRRTVCGLLGLQLPEVVSDLGAVEPARRCHNCDRMRAAIGASRPGAAPAASEAAGAAELTERELAVMMHATGWDSRWPLYRNHFCAGEGHKDHGTILGLVARGFMRVSREPSQLSGGDTVYGVTAIGIAALRGKSGRVGSGEANNQPAG